MTAQPEEPDQPDTPTTGPLSRTCPRCTAPPGQHCITNTKRNYKGHHAGRVKGRLQPATRPFTITPELTTHITDKLATGATLETAARTAGIGRTTLFRWLQLGESDDPDHAQFRYFRDAVERARAEGNAGMVENIHKAGFERVKSRKVVIDPQTKRPIYGDDGELLYDESYELDWKAHSWILERSFSAEWGRHQTLEITGDGPGAGEVRGAAEADALATRVHESLRAEAAQYRLEAAAEAEGDIVDGEVVEGPVE